MNKHAKNQGYAIKKRRTKPSRKDVVMKAAIVCDAHGKAIFAGQDHRNTASRRKECPFRCNAKLKDNHEDENGIEEWELTLITSEHNHPPTGQSAHPIHRKAVMTEEIKREIEKKFLKNSKTSSTLTDLRLDGDSGNSIFKPQDIWNAHQQLKAKQLGSLTPTQAVIKHLDDAEKWYMDYKKKPRSDELE